MSVSEEDGGWTVRTLDHDEIDENASVLEGICRGGVVSVVGVEVRRSQPRNPERSMTSLFGGRPVRSLEYNAHDAPDYAACALCLFLRFRHAMNHVFSIFS